MPSRTVTRVPKYRLHKPSGQAVVTLVGRDHYLGPYNSDESKERYSRLIAEYMLRGTEVSARPGSMTVGDLAHAYLDHLQKKHAEPWLKANLPIVKMAFDRLLRLYESSPAVEFGPVALKVVRGEMMRANWVRTSVNVCVGMIRRMFRWGVAEELLPQPAH